MNSDEEQHARLHERVDAYRDNPAWLVAKLHALLDLAEEYSGPDEGGLFVYDEGRKDVAEKIQQIVGVTSAHDRERL